MVLCMESITPTLDESQIPNNAMNAIFILALFSDKRILLLTIKTQIGVEMYNRIVLP